jgi:ribosomal protein S27AE
MPSLAWKCGKCGWCRPPVWVKAIPGPGEEDDYEKELVAEWKREPCPNCGHEDNTIHLRAPS